MNSHLIPCSPINLSGAYTAWQIPLRPSLATLIIHRPEEIPDWALAYVIRLYRTCGITRPETAQGMLQEGWIVMTPRGYLSFYTNAEFRSHFLEISDGS